MTDTSTETEPIQADDFEVRFVRIDEGGQARGTSFHFAECGSAEGIEPSARYVLSDVEIGLLGLKPCKRCYRLTHKPNTEEALATLRKAVELSITEYRQGKTETAENRLKDVEAWIRGDAVRPSL